MELHRFADAADFYRRAEGFLLTDEAQHNLIIGICASLRLGRDYTEHAPYLATVEDRDGVVAAAIRTPPYNLLLSLVRTPDEAATRRALALIAADARREYGTLPGVQGAAAVSRAFAELWHRRTGQPVHKEVALRVFQLETVTPVSGVPGALRRAAAADRDLLIRWLAAFDRETLGGPDARAVARRVDARLDSPLGGLYLWEDGRPVSMAGYGGPTPNGIRVAPVYTPPEHRGRGYASACVAALSQLLLDGGRRYCFLFTDQADPTPNTIYQAIGYRLVGDVDQYAFLPHPEPAQS